MSHFGKIPRYRTPWSRVFGLGLLLVRKTWSFFSSYTTESAKENDKILYIMSKCDLNMIEMVLTQIDHQWSRIRPKAGSQSNMCVMCPLSVNKNSLKMHLGGFSYVWPSLCFSKLPAPNFLMWRWWQWSHWWMNKFIFVLYEHRWQWLWNEW